MVSRFWRLWILTTERGNRLYRKREKREREREREVSVQFCSLSVMEPMNTPIPSNVPRTVNRSTCYIVSETRLLHFVCVFIVLLKWGQNSVSKAPMSNMVSRWSSTHASTVNSRPRRTRHASLGSTTYHFGKFGQTSLEHLIISGGKFFIFSP